MDKRNETERFLFIVYFDEEPLQFELSGDKTVEDIKLQIYNKFQLKPSQQILTGWTKDPNSDNQNLSSFLEFRDNALWVETADLNENVTSSKNLYPKLEKIIDEEDNLDVEASVSFIVEFLNDYDDGHITFRSCRLSDAIAESCFAAEESRKILALYFHNRTDAFAKMFCPNLCGGEINAILDSSYYFLGWDVSKEEYHPALKKSLSINLDIDLAHSMVEKKWSGLFIIYPIENAVTVFSVLYGNKVKSDEVLTTLQEIAKNFNEEIRAEKELKNIKSNATSNDIGAEEFQQLMHEQLGDRDYDCFENDEHEHLKNKIGFSKFGPPQSDTGYDDKKLKEIQRTYEKLQTYNNLHSKWHDQIVVSFIYNCLQPMPEEKLKRAAKYPDYNPVTDINPIPVYIIRKCLGSNNPCRIIIDSDNRVYKSWRDYINDNKLNKCTMVLPKDGRYTGDTEGVVILERHLSPSCGIGQKVLKSTDIVTTALGLASGGVFIAAAVPALVVAPAALAVAGVTGIGVGIYSLIRSSVQLYDRHVHGEDLSFANSEARGAYINIVAGTLGFVGAGATTTVSQLASNGINIGQGARMAVNTIGVANLSANGIGIANSTYQIYDDWVTEQQTPSLLTIVQLSSSILFFGHAVYNFRGAASAIEQAQTNTLKEYQESLRSNRHRKTFDKLMKETVRQNGGDIPKAQSEVILAIRNIPNKDEIFAVLTRNNKLFNKEGIKFSASKQEIKLNGMKVDLLEFGGMEKTSRSQYLVELPSIPEPTQANSKFDLSSSIETVFKVNNSVNFLEYGKLLCSGSSFFQIAATLLRDFSPIIQEKIIYLYKALFDDLLGYVKEFKVLTKYFPDISSDPCVIVFHFVMTYLKNEAHKFEEQYNEDKEIARHLPNFDEIEFNAKYRIQPNSVISATTWIERLVNTIFSRGRIDEILLKELFSYVRNLVTQKLYEYHKEEEEKEKRRKKRKSTSVLKDKRISCDVCGGYYFSK